MTRPKLIAALLLALTAIGCEVGPNYSPPKISVMDDWGEQGPEPTTQASTRPSRTVSRAPAMVEWWTTFHDPQLDDLIHRAIIANLDLQRATARVLEARAERGEVVGSLLPDVNLDGQYEHVRASKNGVVSAFGASGPAVNAGGAGAGAGANGSPAIPGAGLKEFDLYQGGFDASWELDLFGGQRRALEAANAAVGAAVEDRRDVLLSLVAEVARNYVDLRAGQQRLRIARKNLALQQQSLGLTREQFTRGLTNQFDLARAQAQVSTTQAQIPLLETDVSRSIHRLSVLIDLRPTALAGDLAADVPVPVMPDSVPVGLPGDLLRRRPDIRRAERQLAAQTAAIGVATADLFPKVSLVGSTGLQSLQAKQFTDYDSRFYSFGPMISWPLFDAGRIRENIHVQEARQLQALLQYRQTVLNSFQEVEDGLVAYGKSQERTAALREAVTANQQAVRIAKDLYAQGLADFLSVLDAERSLEASEDALAMSQSQTATNLIALYKSLGGGWELDAAQNAPGAAQNASSDADKN